VACLFGPERTGLDNEDVARANAIVTVDVNPQFPSLNLASCVLLRSYEWRRATVEAPAVREQMAGTEWAEGLEIDHLVRHYEERLEEAGYFFPTTRPSR
jgi:tRNA/rRNA methyltransferase